MPFSAPFGSTDGCESPRVTAHPWRSFTVLGALLPISEGFMSQSLEKVGPDFFSTERIYSFRLIQFKKNPANCILSFLCMFPYLHKIRTHLLMLYFGLWSPVSEPSTVTPPLEGLIKPDLSGLCAAPHGLIHHPLSSSNQALKSKWKEWLGKPGYVSRARGMIDGTALSKWSIQKSGLFSESWCLLRCIKNFKLLITKELNNLIIEALTR